MNELIDYIAPRRPQDIWAGLALMIIPVANPDGLAYGGLRGRSNADGVDLNRNWSCEWSREAYWRQDRAFLPA